MKAVELRTRTEADGSIKLEHTGLSGGVLVRILILSEEEEGEEEKRYLKTISRNPAFDFLNEPEEDIYNTKDGNPFKR
ncbi:hypothetical protein [Algoriphagus chordae]|uniref:Uncharacterized protein n=1 Tax=Algoriphagus chordae TaxID=237019 RepID=A0A2W7QQW6_9BACT|nr:hypothetical protein [Algoriphagus chordae]PZX48430.1 hypothetical protein LV85_03674 [Algoriphagus chordae]